jgi:hypothetical protein
VPVLFSRPRAAQGLNDERKRSDVRTVGEAIGCRCSGTLCRAYHLTEDGFLLDNPYWACDYCGLVVEEKNPERVAPWAPEELRQQFQNDQPVPRKPATIP